MVAKLSGLSTRTIDYYTQLGLLPYSRSETNYRLYSESVLEKIKQIQQLKESRLTLQEIREVIAGREKIVSASKVDKVNEELQRLQKKIELLKIEIEQVSLEEKQRVSKEIQVKLMPVLQTITTLLS